MAGISSEDQLLPRGQSQAMIIVLSAPNYGNQAVCVVNVLVMVGVYEELGSASAVVQLHGIRMQEIAQPNEFQESSAAACGLFNWL